MRLIFALLILAVMVSLTAAQDRPGSEEIIREYVQRYLGVEHVHPEHVYGFVGQLAIAHYRDSIDAVLPRAMRIETYAVPEREFFHRSPKGHFRLHYDLSGFHAVSPVDNNDNSIPDFIDTAAVIFDDVWELEVEQMGFKEPLDLNGNPVEEYDIYFSNLSSGLYGQTVFRTDGEGFPMDVSSRQGAQYASYIEMDNDFQNSGLYTKGIDALRVTAAHEFNHALQVSYRVDLQQDLFFFEATSTWLEEYVYPDVNDYFQYLPGLFSNLQSRAFSSSSFPFPYANGLFANMLSRQYGPDIIVDVWREIQNRSAVSALRVVLSDRGSSFAEAHNDYGRWLFFSGKNALPGLFFEDAAEFPDIPIYERNRYDVFGSINIEQRVLSESFSFIELNNILPYRQRATAGNSSGLRGGGHFTHFSETSFDRASVALGKSQIIEPLFTDTITVLLSNVADSTQTISLSLQPDTVSASSIGPNPINISAGEKQAYFYNVPASATVYIYDLNGRALRALKNGTPERSHISWNVKDYNGHFLSSGVYIYVIQGKGIKKQGKFAVIR